MYKDPKQQRAAQRRYDKERRARLLAENEEAQRAKERQRSREQRAKLLAKNPEAQRAKEAAKSRRLYWRKRRNNLRQHTDKVRAQKRLYRARRLAKNPEALRSKEAAKSRAWYRRHREQQRLRNKEKRKRIPAWYVRNCLRRRGWIEEEIKWALSNPELLETIRTQIKLKREIRHGNQQPV